LYLSMLNHYWWQGKNAHIKGGQGREHRVCRFQSASLTKKGEVKDNLFHINWSKEEIHPL
jgi:hypothetical protein